MNSLFDNDDAPGELIKQVSVLVARASNDLARVQELLDAHRKGASERLNDLLKRKSSLTPKGNIRQLGKSIVALLDQLDRPMTSAEISDALYSESFGIDRSLFRRRVIVVVSRMFKEGRFIMKVDIDGERENRWGLIQWNKDPSRFTALARMRAEALTKTTKATSDGGLDQDTASVQ